MSRSESCSSTRIPPIQMSEEQTCNSEDTQLCSFKAFFALGRLLHWPMY